MENLKEDLKELARILTAVVVVFMSMIAFTFVVAVIITAISFVFS